MKKNIGNSLYNRNGKNAAFGTRTSLEWFLDVGHHLGTMIEREAMQIARVDRSTWQRWRRGESAAPAGTIELLRLHAFGEPPGGLSRDWKGFMFKRGFLVTDWGEDLTPGDLRNFRLFKKFWHEQHEPVKIVCPEPEIYFSLKG